MNQSAPGLGGGRRNSDGTIGSAFAALATDSEFLADAEKSNLDVKPVAGEAVDKVVALIAATPADVADRFAKIFAPSGSR